MRKVKRIRKLEYSWNFKDSFITNGYVVTTKDNKKYVIWAKNSTHAKYLIDCKIDIATYEIDKFDHFENRLSIEPYWSKRYKKEYGYLPAIRPFWFCGRVYMLEV